MLPWGEVETRHPQIEYNSDAKLALCNSAVRSGCALELLITRDSYSDLDWSCVRRTGFFLRPGPSLQKKKTRGTGTRDDPEKIPVELRRV